MELHGWVKGNPNLTTLIEYLIREKKRYLLKNYRSIHRNFIHDPYHTDCLVLHCIGEVANQNLNHSSFCTITSDTALEYVRGDVNYTICFQISLTLTILKLMNFRLFMWQM